MGCTSSAPNISEPHSHTTENGKKEINDDKQDDDNLKQMETNEKTDPEQDESTNVECNIIKMLPTCDTLDQNLELDRKLNSPQHVVTNEQEERREMAGTNHQTALAIIRSHLHSRHHQNSTKGKDDPVHIMLKISHVNLNETDDNVTMETNKEIPSIELEEVPSKISTFEKVVDQLVLENILDDVAKLSALKDNDLQNDDKAAEENVIQDNPVEIKIACDSDELDEINEEEDDLIANASPSQSECSRATRWEALADIAAELPPSLAVDPVTGQIYSLTK